MSKTSYDSWKTSAPEGEEPVTQCSRDCEGCPDCSVVENSTDEFEIPREPPLGSWASIARIMAEGDDSGFDWDAWKDEMKERDWE